MAGHPAERAQDSLPLTEWVSVPTDRERCGVNVSLASRAPCFFLPGQKLHPPALSCGPCFVSCPFLSLWSPCRNQVLAEDADKELILSQCVALPWKALEISVVSHELSK